MKGKGFIATSLIYSFFLVFIAIMAALLCNFIANKLILVRYNDDSQDALNTNRYTVKLVSFGAEASTEDQKGQTMYNLVRDGSFENIDTWWSKSGSITATKYNLAKPSVRFTNASPNSYLYQRITRINENHKYYMSMEYAQSTSEPVQTYLYSNAPLISKPNSTSWEKTSNIFEGTEGSNVEFKVGISSLSYTNVYITNVMLIDLTEHYGEGLEPTVEWLDENIDYFEDTMNYLKKEEISGGDSLEINMVTNKDTLKTVTLNCTSNKWVDSSDNRTIEYKKTEDNKKVVATVTLKNIDDDISCTARWE